MAKATKDFPVIDGRGPIEWRDANAPRHSPSGIIGDATVATREKGEKIVAAQIDFFFFKIQDLRTH
jgi:creatinine amidohydrolase/Fe(II)-dependent formamide hydrolase-like protein